MVGLAAVVLVAVGCGDGSSDGGSGASDGVSAAQLTRYLPPDQISYVAVDLDALRSEGLLADDDPIAPPGEDADPLASFAVGSALSGLAATPLDDATTEALDLKSATAMAGAGGSGANVTAFATSADADDITSALEEVGYAEQDGVLTSDDKEAAFRVDDGVVIAAAGEEGLSRVPGEPLGEAPDPLLEESGSPYTEALIYDGGDKCLRSMVTALNGDGTGTVSFRTVDAPDPKNLTFEDTDSASFDDPVVDGDVISVDGTGDPSALAIRNTIQQFFFFYDC